MAEKMITIEQVEQVARLARLSLDEAQSKKLRPELQSILDYIAKIGQADLADVDLAAAGGRSNVLRDDEPTAALPLEAVLRNAPAVDGAFFAVPKVLGGDEDSAG